MAKEKFLHHKINLQKQSNETYKLEKTTISGSIIEIDVPKEKLPNLIENFCNIAEPDDGATLLSVVRKAYPMLKPKSIKIKPKE